MIILDQANGIFISDLTLGVITGAMAMVLVPLAIWVVNQIFFLKGKVAVIMHDDQNFNTKLDNLADSLEKNNKEMKENIKEMNMRFEISLKGVNDKLDSFLSKEFHLMKHLLSSGGPKNGD